MENLFLALPTDKMIIQARVIQLAVVVALALAEALAEALAGALAGDWVPLVPVGTRDRQTLGVEVVVVAPLEP